MNQRHITARSLWKKVTHPREQPCFVVLFGFLFLSYLENYHQVMLFLSNELTKKAEINILTARDTTGPEY